MKVGNNKILNFAQNIVTDAIIHFLDHTISLSIKVRNNVKYSTNVSAGTLLSNDDKGASIKGVVGR